MVTIRGVPGDRPEVEVSGCPGGGRFDLEDPGGGVLMWSADLSAPGGTMRLHGIYDGCWAFAVGQTDEADPLPDWPTAFASAPDEPGVVELRVGAPDGARLEDVRPAFD